MNNKITIEEYKDFKITLSEVLSIDGYLLDTDGSILLDENGEPLCE